MITTHIVPADSKRRVVAYLIDTMIAFVLVLPLWIFSILPPLMYVGKETNNFQLSLDEVITPRYRFWYYVVVFINVALLFMVRFIYSIILEKSNWQGTIGKRIFGLFTTDLHENRITLRSSIVRAFFKEITGVSVLWFSVIISGCSLLAWMIPIAAFLIILTSDTRQGIHDRVAHTFVRMRVPMDKSGDRSVTIIGKKVKVGDISQGDKTEISIQIPQDLYGIDLSQLNLEISNLIKKLETQSKYQDRDIAINSLNAAKNEAHRGDRVAAYKYLSIVGKLGKEMYDFAKEVGADIVAAVILSVMNPK